MTVFNLIITHGDTFLPDTVSYDACYYEVIRNAALFDQLNELRMPIILAYSLAVNAPTSPLSPNKRIKAAGSDISNILAISTHFLPKIEAKQAENNTPLDTDQARHMRSD